MINELFHSTSGMSKLVKYIHTTLISVTKSLIKLENVQFKISYLRPLPITLSTCIRYSAIVRVFSTSYASIYLRDPKRGGIFKRIPLEAMDS